MKRLLSSDIVWSFTRSPGAMIAAAVALALCLSALLAP